jgi:hypothetical protein
MAQFQGQLDQLASETDPEVLRGALAQIDAQSGAMPPMFKTMFDYVRQEIGRRIAEIEGGAE